MTRGERITFIGLGLAVMLCGLVGALSTLYAAAGIGALIEDFSAGLTFPNWQTNRASTEGFAEAINRFAGHHANRVPMYSLVPIGIGFFIVLFASSWRALTTPLPPAPSSLDETCQ
ncbi:MAG: hypothetical protein H7Y88_02120 [Phycisphaerales bacterium]|nr:hypothetical protein [Phycisphaerales bacterium]